MDTNRPELTPAEREFHNDVRQKRQQVEGVLRDRLDKVRHREPL